MTVNTVAISDEKIAEFCQRWHIIELALFWSVLRGDFGPDSDVDVLVTFAAGSQRSLLDEAQMELDLKAPFGRKVDMLSRSAVERSPNWLRREEILSTAVPIYGR